MNFKFYAFVIYFVLFSYCSSAQIIINYPSWTPPNPLPCNIFGSPTNVNGYIHQTTLGQPQYDGTGGTINLNAKSVGGIFEGTEYRLAYPFKKYYTYKITIRAHRIIPTASSPDIHVRIDLDNGTLPTNGSCNGMSGTNRNNTGYIQTRAVTNNAPLDLIFNFNVAHANLNYLLIGAVAVTETPLSTILIREIKIEESLNQVFSISPSTVSKTCGSSITQTFSVNPSDVPGITSYEWNLGSSNNGWIYNNQPAPQFIFTTSNSITLSSPNCAALQPVSVTVKINNVNHQTITSAAINNQPSYQINGATTVCGQSDVYNIQNLPCGASVSWSANPAGIVSISTSNNQATLNKITDGTVNLTAIISGCGNPVTIDKNVSFGIPKRPELIEMYGNGLYDPMYICPGGYRVEAWVPAPNNVTGFEWELPHNWTSNKSGGTNPFILDHTGFDIPVQVGQMYYPDYITVRTINTCGYSFPIALEVYTGCERFRTTTTETLIVYPNPASSHMTITVNKEKGGADISKADISEIKTINIYNKLGFIVKSFTTKNKSTIVSVNVSDLPSDVYTLEVSDGKVQKRKQIIIKR